MEEREREREREKRERDRIIRTNIHTRGCFRWGVPRF